MSDRSETLLVKMENVNFSYSETKILNGMSLKIKHNEIVALIGSSGSGKTTLMKLITGLLVPQKGVLQASKASYMMQQDFLLPWRNVLDNMILFSELGKNPEAKRNLRRKALCILEQMGLKGYDERYPYELSGGMRQRISLAMVLLQNNPLLLLDEPFGSLDICVRDQMYGLVRNYQKEQKTSVLLITHDFRDATTLADRILLLLGGTIHNEWHLSQEIKENPLKVTELHTELKSHLNQIRL